MFRSGGIALRRKKHYVIYPQYFNKKSSRSQGRRVPLDIAIENPGFNKLKTACKFLELQFIVQPEKLYPINSAVKGRVLVEIDRSDKISKEQLLKEISKIMTKLISKSVKTSKVKSKQIKVNRIAARKEKTDSKNKGYKSRGKGKLKVKSKTNSIQKKGQ